jgi:Peptidase inhibitor family I36
MSNRRITLGVLAAATLAAAAVGVAPAATAATPAQVTPHAYSSCSPGYFCMFSGWNGTGSKCQYSADVANTATLCSFIRAGEDVKSVYNLKSVRATYYKADNYASRIGSTAPAVSGNLEGNYQIRSISF